MKECEFEESLTAAEKACTGCVAKLFAKVKTCRAINPGEPDCNVFDIGHLNIGDNMAFSSDAYCFRAELDLYRRDRGELQRDLMRLVAALPIGADNNAEAELRQTSNVLAFRIAPEASAVGGIFTAEVVQGRDVRPVLCWQATVRFDVVFRARF